MEIAAGDFAQRSEQIAVRLFPRDMAVLRREAKALGVGHTSLARMIVEKWAASRRPAGDP